MWAGDPDKAQLRHSADFSMQCKGADSLSGHLSLMLGHGDESGAASGSKSGEGGP